MGGENSTGSEEQKKKSAKNKLGLREIRARARKSRGGLEEARAFMFQAFVHDYDLTKEIYDALPAGEKEEVDKLLGPDLVMGFETGEKSMNEIALNTIECEKGGDFQPMVAQIEEMLKKGGVPEEEKE